MNADKIHPTRLNPDLNLRPTNWGDVNAVAQLIYDVCEADGDQIAGITLNRTRQGIGWIGRLGVRPPWRGKGLGLSLLQKSFYEFYNRGMKTIGLMVDAQNPTGATRLYKRAGMHVASEFVMYEKEIRPGKDVEE